MSQTDAILRIHMATQSMNDLVSGPVFHECPIDHLVLATLGRKTECCICDPCHTVWMCIFIHIVIHVIICLRFVFIPEKLAETVRKGKGHNPFIYKLIYSKRHLHAFISGLQLFSKAISLHKITVFLFLSLMLFSSSLSHTGSLYLKLLKYSLMALRAECIRAFAALFCTLSYMFSQTDPLTHMLRFRAQYQRGYIQVAERHLYQHPPSFQQALPVHRWPPPIRGRSLPARFLY